MDEYRLDAKWKQFEGKKKYRLPDAQPNAAAGNTGLVIQLAGTPVVADRRRNTTTPTSGQPAETSES